MSFLQRFLNGDDTDETDTTNTHDPTEGSYARPLDDFPASHSGEAEEVKNEEINFTSDTGDVYAGEWVREMFENAKRNPTQPTWLGYEEARNPIEGANEVGLLHEELNSHMAVFGASGYGKSTLLLNMMTQWAYAGYGFCFIDPKGQDSYNLMQMLPEDRLDDVYWIEPGTKEYEKVIGMNFLHTHSEKGDPEFDGEVEHVISDLIPILKATSQGWGAAMDSIVKNVTRKMLEDEAEYNLLDIYFLLNNPDWREELPTYYQDQPMLRQQASQIAQYDQEDVRPLLRRFQTFAESRPAREVVAHEGSDIDAHDVINNNKIIILRTAEVGEDLQKIISTTVMRRLWSVIGQRSKNEDHDPYFLVADEFGAVAGAGNNVEHMLSRGRSLGLSMTISTQQPSQLDDLQDSLGNVKNFISFSPGDEDDARFISGRIDMDADMLMRLPRFNAYCNLRVDGQKKSGPVRTNTFAPYPPLRTEDKVEQIIADIVDKYGQEPQTSEDLEPERNPLERIENSSDTTGGESPDTPSEIYTVTEVGDRLTEDELLEVVFDAQLATGDGDPDSFTTVDEVERQLSLHLGKNLDEYGTKVSHALEQLPEGHLDKDLDDQVYLKLSPSGRDRVFATDSGESSSAGKLIHRVLLEKSYLLFRRLGYDVEIPRQEGRMPDGIAKPKPDVNPNTADTYREAQERATALAERYPRLEELFGTDELHIEPESVTLTKPKQPFKNLIKAMEQGRKCVYVVRDGEPEGHDFAHYARRIHGWIDDQKFAKRYDGEDRIFYNYSKKFEFEDGAVAVKNEDGTYSTWRDKGNKIVLESPDDIDEPYAEFSSADALDNCKKSDFTHYYIRDNSKGETILRRGDGKKLGSYANKDGIMNDGFTPVRQPFIPERELPEWPLPDDWDGYEIVIIPSDDKPDMSPQIYDVDDEYDDEYVPIFNEDDTIKSIHSIETDADLDEQLDIEPSDPTDTPDEDDTPTLEPGDDSDDFDHLDQAIVDETTENADDSGPRATTLSEMMDLKDERGETADDESDTDTNTDNTSESTANTAPDNATNADEVPVADPDDKPKSNTDVVKESDEVWNQPEEGDDDYNPAKDNSNYRTGYNEDYVDDDYTGGEAREADKEGDFDDYVPPSERADTDTGTDTSDTTSEEDTADERDDTPVEDEATGTADETQTKTDATDEDEDEDDDGLDDPLAGGV